MLRVPTEIRLFLHVRIGTESLQLTDPDSGTFLEFEDVLMSLPAWNMNVLF